MLMRSNALEGISNLHHMFPCDVRANKYRGDNAFADVDDRAAKWIKADRSPPNIREKEAGSAGRFDKSRHVFQPRDISKGNIARAMFYMAAIYGEQLFTGHNQADRHRNWWHRQKETLLRWNRDHPPNKEEVARTWNIARVQGRVNPFIVHPEWIDKAFFNIECVAQSAVYDIVSKVSYDIQVQCESDNITDFPNSM